MRFWFGIFFDVTHALAVEVHLRPALIEIGATLPTRGLYVLEEQLGDIDAVIDTWLVEAAAPLRACLTARSAGGVESG